MSFSLPATVSTNSGQLFVILHKAKAAFFFIYGLELAKHFSTSPHVSLHISGEAISPIEFNAAATIN